LPDYPDLGEAEFLALFQDLLPQGLAWPREPDRELSQLLSALASELAAFHALAGQLAVEVDPARTNAMLPEWERVVGLPDPCFALLETIDARRLAVIGRLKARGGQSPAYFRDLSAGYGWPIDIIEPRPFTAGESAAGDYVYAGEGVEFVAGGSVAGDPLQTIDWRYVWQVLVDPLIATFFLAGESVAGDALAEYDHPPLRCVIAAGQPAHTEVLYRWREDPNNPLFAPSTSRVGALFEAGTEAGLPLAYDRVLTFRHRADPLASIESAGPLPAEVTGVTEDVFAAGSPAGIPLAFERHTTLRAGADPLTAYYSAGILVVA
jgi:uncharacterized protein YmfQ (DUF2313 family)